MRVGEVNGHPVTFTKTLDKRQLIQKAPASNSPRPMVHNQKNLPISQGPSDYSSQPVTDAALTAVPVKEVGGVE